MRLLGQFQTFFFFYDKISQALKSIKSTKKHKKALKSTKKHNHFKIYQFKIYRHKIYQHKIHEFKIHQA